MRYILLFTAFFAISSSASDLSYLKKENPDELGIWVFAGPSCPMTGKDVEGLVSGVLIRSRLKPKTSGWVSEPLYLEISVDCLALEGNNPVYTIVAGFGRFVPKPSIMYDKGYGTFGIGPKESINRAIKNATESAVTAYIQANFINN
ncbi:hypothetical protein OAE19_00645 [Porticoccaceae bacterium]|nr:hypothetical protein [Porticoccaceae bacterium]